MRVKNICRLAAALFFLSACNRLSFRQPENSYPSLEQAFSQDYEQYANDEADYVDEGYYGGDEPVEQVLGHYENVLPKRWREVKSLDYSEGNFSFPPVSGHRVLHYEDQKTSTRLDLYREVITFGTYMDIINRRQATDHCGFADSSYRKLKDIEIVKANSNCHVWLEGDYLRKYYFVKVGSVVYTFRLLSPSSEYIFAEPDFDNFVNNTLKKYLVHSPRRQDSPVPGALAQGNSSLQGKQEASTSDYGGLSSFFSP